MRILSRNFPAANQLKLLNELIDEQGRTILKVQQNPQENNSESITSDIGSSKANASSVASEDVIMQRSIITALTKYGLPPSDENTAKIFHYIQDFNAKYQQPIKAQVFTFIMAQKWPVTPATILASWVFQEPEVRELLWDKLRKPLSEQDTTKKFLSQISLKMQCNPPEIVNLLKSLNTPKVKTDSAIIGTKSQTDAETKKFSAENNIDIHQEKIQLILEQNIAINKAILKETTVGGLCNLIPLVVSDSQSTIHECMVQWKEEKSSNSSAGDDQTIYMTIPTDNLGNINLVLRSGPSGTRINLRVNTEEVRKCFIENTLAMKAALTKDNTLITINLKENEDINPNIPGVDLWM